MADNKPQRHRLTTQQRREPQPFTTPLGLQILHHNLWCPKLLQSCYITEEPEYYTETPKHYTIKAPEYYTTTYAAPAYTEAPNYCNTEAPIYYTTTYAAPSYYTDAPKYYSS